MSHADCIFCSIIAGDAPASWVYQDDLVVVFLTIEPVTDGHLLVCPREHYAYLNQVPDVVATRMFKVAREAAEALRSSKLRSDGINLFYADGEAAFQEVFHSHLHVFPRFEGDGFTIDADWSYRPARERLDEVASAIRAEL